MAVTTRPETVEQETPGRRPEMDRLDGGGAGGCRPHWGGHRHPDRLDHGAGKVTFSSVQAREAGSAVPATELERFSRCRTASFGTI